MPAIKLFLSAILAALALSPAAFAQIRINVGGIGLTLPTNGSSSSGSSSRSGSSRSSSSGSSSAACVSGHDRWSTFTDNNATIATNFQGVFVGYDSHAAPIVVMSLSSPLDDTYLDQPLNSFVNFDSRGATPTQTLPLFDLNSTAFSAEVSDELIRDLMRKSCVEISVPGNTVKTSLRGSSAAIKAVLEEAAQRRRQMILSNQTTLEAALVANAISRATKRTERQADAQIVSEQSSDGIRPDNTELGTSLRSQNLPDTLVRYYIPGTTTTGNMWTDSDVKPGKGLVIALNFVEPGHAFTDIAHTIELSNVQAKALINALKVSSDWTAIAQENNVGLYSDIIDNVVFDEDEGTEVNVVFNSYEDGSTAAQIENKILGYSKKFNFSIQNALELARYTNEVLLRAEKDREDRSRSEEEVKALFTLGNGESN